MSGTVPVELGRAVPSHCFGVCVVRVWANERHQACWARGVPKVHRVIFNVTHGGQDVSILREPESIKAIVPETKASIGRLRRQLCLPQGGAGRPSLPTHNSHSQ
jgi:hypothetical protein